MASESEIRGVQPKEDKGLHTVTVTSYLGQGGGVLKLQIFADVLYGWLIRHFDPL